MNPASKLLGPTTVQGTGEKRTITCEKHGEFNMPVLIIGGKERVPQCPSCHLEQLRRDEVDNTISLEEEKAKRKQRGLAELLGYSGIPPRYLKRGFGNYQATTPEQHRVLGQAQSYAIDFADKRKAGDGLLFIGPTGTGKTHLANAICKKVITDGFTAYFTSVLSVMQVIKESYRRDSEMSEREAIAKFVEPDLLAIDEVGVQHNSETERMFMTQLIDQRYQQMKPTILLSNLPVQSQHGESLMSVLGERVISRLKEANEVIVCDWEDYRAA